MGVRALGSQEPEESEEPEQSKHSLGRWRVSKGDKEHPPPWLEPRWRRERARFCISLPPHGYLQPLQRK